MRSCTESASPRIWTIRCEAASRWPSRCCSDRSMPLTLNSEVPVAAPGLEDAELHRIRFAEDMDDPLRGSLTLAILLLFLGSGISGIIRHNPHLITLKRDLPAKVDIVQVDLTTPPQPPP